MPIDLPGMAASEILAYLKNRVTEAEEAIALIGTKLDKQMEARLYGSIESAQQATRLGEFDRLRNLINRFFETSDYYKRMREVFYEKATRTWRLGDVEEREGSLSHTNAFVQFLAHSFQIDKLGLPLPVIREEQKNQTELVHIEANWINSELAKLVSFVTLNYPEAELDSVYSSVKAITANRFDPDELIYGAWKSGLIPAHIKSMTYSEYAARYGEIYFDDKQGKGDYLLLGRYDKSAAQACALNWYQVEEIAEIAKRSSSIRQFLSLVEQLRRS